MSDSDVVETVHYCTCFHISLQLDVVHSYNNKQSPFLIAHIYTRELPQKVSL